MLRRLKIDTLQSMVKCENHCKPLDFVIEIENNNRIVNRVMRDIVLNQKIVVMNEQCNIILAEREKNYSEETKILEDKIRFLEECFKVEKISNKASRVCLSRIVEE